MTRYFEDITDETEEKLPEKEYSVRDEEYPSRRRTSDRENKWFLYENGYVTSSKEEREYSIQRYED